MNIYRSHQRVKQRDNQSLGKSEQKIKYKIGLEMNLRGIRNQKIH